MVLELLLFGIICCLLYFSYESRPHGLPPGDWGYPFIGNIVIGRDNLWKFLYKQQQKYGNIFSIKIGSQIVVVLTDFKLIKEAFSKEALSGRPRTVVFEELSNHKGYGLVPANGHKWQVNRRFAMKTLRDFGLGKTIIETVVEREVETLIKEFAKRVGEPMKIDLMLNVAILNVIWTLVADKRFVLEDKEIHQFMHLVQRNLKIVEDRIGVLDLFPWIHKLMPRFLLDKYFHMAEFENNFDLIMSYMKKHIEEHKKNFDRNNLKDYIDMYLLDLEDGGAEEDNAAFKKDLDNLTSILINLFFAGSDTTASSFRWFLLYMCKYQDTQQRIQQEIDANVPKDRFPTLQDRERLTFLESTIFEVFRMVSLVPAGVPHAAMEDTYLSGYRIPKGTQILPALEICHKSPEYFPRPLEFQPERFLDENGKLDTKKEGLIPFSIGRRICIGEALAKTELFLLTSAVLQKFTVSVPKNIDVNLRPKTDNPVFNYPPNFEIIFTDRK